MVTEAPFGHDQEFRTMFADEATGRLDALIGTLLAIDQPGAAAGVLDELLRELHTLKGASAMVGLVGVTGLVHSVEDVFEPYRGGVRAPSAELVDAALSAVDGLRAVIEAAGRGEEDPFATVRVKAVLAAMPPAAEAQSEAPTESSLDAGSPADAPTPPRLHAAVPEEATVDAAGAAALLPTPSVDAGPSSRIAPARATRSEASTITLPVARLDQLVRLVGEAASALMRTGRLVGEATGRDPAGVTEYRDLSRALAELQELVIRTRMVPVASIANPLQRAVRELSRGLGKDVRWELVGGDTELDRRVLDQLADPLLHLVRNAVDHGLESPEERMDAGKPRQGVVRLHAMQLGPEVIIAISDDGRGIDVGRVRDAAARNGPQAPEQSDEEAVYSIFRPGLSTARRLTDVSGRGVGLDVVRESLHGVRGRIEVRNNPGLGCEFRIAVPITLAVLPCLIVVSGARRYAIPRYAVLTAISVDADSGLHAGGPMVRAGAQAVPLSSLAATLGSAGGNSRGPAVVLSGLTRSHAFQVDSLVGQRDVVIKGLGDLLPRLDVVAGAGIEADGSVLLVLDPAGLIERAHQTRNPATAAPFDPTPVPTQKDANPPSVLVVDDALAIRELQRAILQRAGYEVRTASDGVEALALLAERPSDLIITDVEMPRLGGFDLTRAIRAQPGVRNAAILILTSRGSDDDRRHGLEAGADGYIVKSSFDQGSLIGAVERLLGRPS